MAYNSFHVLSSLLKSIDDARNDIYLHIDKKTKHAPISILKDSVDKSKLTIISEIDVTWGAASSVSAELLLIEKAISSGTYSYLHLISGQDLPIKSQNYIHSFFIENEGKEYIDCCNAQEFSKYKERISLYHLFREYIGRNKSLVILPIRIIDKISKTMQRIINIDRTKKYNLEYYYGANWFSITNELAEYVIENKHAIIDMCRYTTCADEIWLQTLAMNSRFSNNVTKTNMRFVDWNRGNPYVFRADDFELLTNSKMLFARKFDDNVDLDIVNNLLCFVLS